VQELEAKFGFKAESEKHDPTKTNAATQIELEEGDSDQRRSISDALHH